jgi:hypothetical protein
VSSERRREMPSAARRVTASNDCMFIVVSRQSLRERLE